MISVVVAIGTVTATYPGGWGQLPRDLLTYGEQQRLHDNCTRERDDLVAALEAAQQRYEVQTAWLEQLVAEQLTLRQVAVELDHLYENEPIVVCGLRRRFPDAASDTELMAAIACYKAFALPGTDERRMERLHDEFRREFGKTLPPPRNTYVNTPDNTTPGFKRVG